MKDKLYNFIKRSAVRYPILIILSIFMGLGIFHMNASTLLGNAFPMPFGFGVSVIVTGSMEPTLTAGSLVIIQPQESYKENDIVAFQIGDMAVVHRIVSIGDEGVITQGDANNITDDPIPLEAIQGKIVYDIPAVGKYIWYLKSPPVILLILLIAIILIELPYQIEKSKKLQEKEAMKAEIRKLLEEMDQHEAESEGGPKKNE